MEMRTTVLRDSSQFTQNDIEPVMQPRVLLFFFFQCFNFFIFKLLTCVKYPDHIFRQNLFF